MNLFSSTCDGGSCFPRPSSVFIPHKMFVAGRLLSPLSSTSSLFDLTDRWVPLSVSLSRLSLSSSFSSSPSAFMLLSNLDELSLVFPHSGRSRKASAAFNSLKNTLGLYNESLAGDLRNETCPLSHKHSLQLSLNSLHPVTTCHV